MKVVELIFMPIAVVVGISLIPVALVIAIPDFIYSIKDSLCRE